ncbi:MAG TPA: hypothetical protein PKA13_16870 [Geminicoccaceae bacterium]|nr:hypothetical protein [Geminicoccus sp.]HMU51450.1 hypothetical protein [Geminicoccaceae bacterium]
MGVQRASAPSIERIAAVAKILDERPEWLAYGINQEPRIEYRQSEGTVTIAEVMFGTSPSEEITVGSWAAPVEWIHDELRADPAKLRLVELTSDAFAPQYEEGEKLLVDLSMCVPQPKGMFLIADGVGVSLAKLTIVPGSVPMIRVAPSRDESYEVEVSKLRVVGKVRRQIKRVR